MSQWQPSDSERLDWLERTFSAVTTQERYLPLKMIWGKGANGRTMREAIDKYMAREPAQPEIQKGNADLVEPVKCESCKGKGILPPAMQWEDAIQCPRCLGTGVGEVVAMPIDTAPRDGTMVRLLVQFTDHATEDVEGPAWTIGANSFDNTGEDHWQFAGWCWSHDHFTEGKGTPVGWLPMHAAQAEEVRNG